MVLNPSLFFTFILYLVFFLCFLVFFFLRFFDFFLFFVLLLFLYILYLYFDFPFFLLGLPFFCFLIFQCFWMASLVTFHSFNFPTFSTVGLHSKLLIHNSTLVTLLTTSRFLLQKVFVRSYNLEQINYKSY